MSNFKRDYNVQEARILAIEKEEKKRNQLKQDQKEFTRPSFSEEMKNKHGMIEIKMSDVSWAITNTLDQDICPLIVCPKFEDSGEDINPVDV